MRSLVAAYMKDGRALAARRRQCLPRSGEGCSVTSSSEHPERAFFASRGMNPSMEDFILWEMKERGLTRRQVLDDHARRQASAEARFSVFLTNLDES